MKSEHPLFIPLLPLAAPYFDLESPLGGFWPNTSFAELDMTAHLNPSRYSPLNLTRLAADCFAPAHQSLSLSPFTANTHLMWPMHLGIDTDNTCHYKSLQARRRARRATAKRAARAHALRARAQARQSQIGTLLPGLMPQSLVQLKEEDSDDDEREELSKRHCHLRCVLFSLVLGCRAGFGRRLHRRHGA